MGVTSPKNFRYPDPTSPGSGVYLDIQKLAEDANGGFVSIDNRLNALDLKTMNTDNEVALKGVPNARYGHSAGVFTHLPPDGALRTVSQHTDQFYITSNASSLLVSFRNSAYASANAAAGWYPLVSFTPGGTNWIGLGEWVSHNQAQPALNIGFEAVMVFNVRDFRSRWGSVALNAYNSPGSAAWVEVGPLDWSVTLLE